MAASNGQGRRAKGARHGKSEPPPHAGDAAAVNGTQVVRATIPSDFKEKFVQIQQQILEAAATHGFGETCLFALKIAVEEALVNAIKHGNKQDKDKQVKVEASISLKRAEITIEDEGPGFDRTSVPDPLAEENLEKPSGRGILLIESYMSQVSWDHGGRRLRMVKNADDQGPGCTVG